MTTATDVSSTRIHLSCKVNPKTMTAINGMFFFPGNEGRKLDALVEEYLRMKSSPAERLKRTEVERMLLANPDMMAWTCRRLAGFFKCSKSLISLVKSEIPSAETANA